MALNRNQRRVLGQGLVAFGVGMMLALVVGPAVTPSRNAPYLLLAAWGVIGGGAFIYIGVKLSE